MRTRKPRESGSFWLAMTLAVIGGALVALICYHFFYTEYFPPVYNTYPWNN